MTEVAVLGIGMHEFGRTEGATGMDQGAVAVRRALADAGLRGEDMQFAVGGSVSAGSADALVAKLGLTGLQFTNVSNGCATGGTGNNLIAYFVGIAVVLAYLPLYWWRKAQDRRLGVAKTSTSTVAADAVPVGAASDRDGSR